MEDILNYFARAEDVAESNFKFCDKGAEGSQEQSLIDQWKRMSEEERSKYKYKPSKFYQANGLSKEDTSQKNFRLMNSESQKRLNEDSNLKYMLLEQVDDKRSIMDLLNMIENVDRIKNIYRLRKKTAAGGINSTEAGKLRSCLRQGRELFEAGCNGFVRVKPLIFFYALTAYAYSIILLNNPLCVALGNLKGSHGVKYLQTNFWIQFGGDVPEGTFSDLFLSFPVIYHKTKIAEWKQDTTESVLKYFSRRCSISVASLLQMLPELQDVYRLATNQNGVAYPIEIKRTEDIKKISWKMRIGQEEYIPEIGDITKCLPDSDAFDFKGNDKGLPSFTFTDDQFKTIKSTFFTDLYGGMWFINHGLFPVVLPEICVHFLLLSIFSNIMRYAPDTWEKILMNETNSGVSLLVHRYLALIEKKLPILLGQILTEYYTVYSR